MQPVVVNDKPEERAGGRVLQLAPGAHLGMYQPDTFRLDRGRLLCVDGADVSAEALVASQRREIGGMRQLAVLDEDEALADLLEDLELEARGRVQADEDQPALGAQAAEEIEHEADVAVLRVELRLVEEVDQRIVASRARSSRTTARGGGNAGPGRIGGSGWRAGRARGSGRGGCPGRRTARGPRSARWMPVISSNSVVLPEPFGPIMPTIAGSLDGEVGVEAEGRPSRGNSPRV